MARAPSFPFLFSKNDPKRDVNKTWQHDLFEPYEALFRADEQPLRLREIRQPAQNRLSNLEPNVSNRQPAKIHWSDLEPNHRPAQVRWADLEQKVSNRRTAQIYLSNLEPNVSTEDLYDLFSLIGNLQNVRLDCDKNGRSLGTAIIVFERKEDAIEAMYRYNGCLLDNKTLKMELIHSSSETTLPVCYMSNISKDIQTNDAAAQSHMDVQNVGDRFYSLKLM